MAFAVRIDKVSREQLEFLGYHLLRENEEFELWAEPTGDEQIVLKSNRFLRVEDINDVWILHASTIHPLPDDDC